MKTIKNILVLAMVALAVSACDLQREDFTQISPETFPKTDKDLELAVNALYYEFNTGGWNGVYEAGNKGYQVISDMSTDVLGCVWGWEWDLIHYQQWYATVGGTMASCVWESYKHYYFMSWARNVVRLIDGATEASQEARDLYRGEANALRGWMGLYLYDFFGPVPVASDEVLDNAESLTYLPRLTDEEYDAMMEHDLRDAIEHLPLVAAANGRMTKGAAMMILLKYYMIRGKYKDAEKLAEELVKMEGAPYGLQTNYAKIFDINNEANNEIVLSIACTSSASWCSNYMTAECLPGDYPWTEKATGWGGYVMPWDFYDTFEPGDSRLACLATSYRSTYGIDVSREWPNGGQLVSGAIINKYGVDPDMADARSGVDLVIYRFSDALLSLAELKVRNSGSVTADAVSLVNRVRNRAGLDDLDASATASVDAFLEALLLERGHEFFMEGLRRQDLIRFGKYAEYANERINKVNALGYGYFEVTDRNNRFWIPQDFIDESKGAIKQNEGY